jgi:hypothetical protein
MPGANIDSVVKDVEFSMQVLRNTTQDLKRYEMYKDDIKEVETHITRYQRWFFALNDILGIFSEHGKNPNYRELNELLQRFRGQVRYDDVIQALHYVINTPYGPIGGRGTVEMLVRPLFNDDIYNTRIHESNVSMISDIFGNKFPRTFKEYHKIGQPQPKPSIYDGY